MKQYLPMILALLVSLNLRAQSSNYYWSKNYGGTKNNVITSVQAHSNSNIVVCGYTRSDDNDVKGNHGKDDVRLALMDSSGAIIWQKCYGGSNDDHGYDVKQTSDGGFIIVGT